MGLSPKLPQPTALLYHARLQRPRERHTRPQPEAREQCREYGIVAAPLPVILVDNRLESAYECGVYSVSPDGDDEFAQEVRDPHRGSLTPSLTSPSRKRRDVRGAKAGGTVDQIRAVRRMGCRAVMSNPTECRAARGSTPFLGPKAHGDGTESRGSGIARHRTGSQGQGSGEGRLREGCSGQTVSGLAAQANRSGSSGVGRGLVFRDRPPSHVSEPSCRDCKR